MLRRSPFHYFWFGSCVRYLQEVRKGNLLGSATGSHVLYNLKELLDLLDEYGLHVTARAAHDLRTITERLDEMPGNHRLTGEEAAAIREEVGSLRRTLIAEMEGHTAFLMTPKRFGSDALLDNVASLFGPGVFEDLPELARFDLEQAGKCVAFEIPTAAAFHLLRATECVLRELYLHLAKRRRVKQLMWGPIVADLRARSKAKHLGTLLNHLDHIRTSFRNPTQHPEKTYDIHEVQDLMGLVIDAINRMAHES